MQELKERFDVGVIVGRFQVHKLHEAHVALIEHVRSEHSKVVVVLGISPLPTTTNNPLDFEARKQMLLERFPDLIIVFNKDHRSDEAWSRNLDEVIFTVVGVNQSTVIYGGRDSFISSYSGRFKVRELEQEVVMSGAALRKDIAASSTQASADFRAGVIWAAHNRYPTAFQTIDVAIVNEDRTRILLGRKPGEDKYRFIGGFSDPRSDSLEHDVRREVIEEVGVEVGDIRYVGSCRIDDHRYRSEVDCIKTAFFEATYTFGIIAPGDDIEEVRWFPFHRNRLPHNLRNDIMPEHHELFTRYMAYIIQNGGTSDDI